MQPNPLKKEAESKAYAKAQVNEVLSFRKFIQHIADHGGYTRGKVKGVLSDMCECLVEMLLEGKKVQLDELGDFWISLSSEGAENCEAFSTDNIKGVNIIFTPGPDFENLLGRAEFAIVASRAAQTATIKAEKTGAKTVDLLAAKKKKPASAGEGADDNKPNGSTGSGSKPSGEGSSNPPAGGSGNPAGGSGSGTTGGNSGEKEDDDVDA